MFKANCGGGNLLFPPRKVVPGAECGNTQGRFKGRRLRPVPPPTSSADVFLLGGDYGRGSSAKPLCRDQPRHCHRHLPVLKR